MKSRTVSPIPLVGDKEIAVAYDPHAVLGVRIELMPL
jgi:hypothetical protein